MQDLSKKQQDSFLHSDARINIFEGPVRAGKSFVALLRWIDFCANGPSGPLIICGRTDKTIKRNIISPLQQLVGKAVVYKQGKGEVQLYNRTMYVIGANDDRAEAKIRGSEFAGALIDEATLIPENFFKMLLSRLSIPGSQLFCSTNPDSPYHWFKKDFIDREAELDLKVFSFDIHDNPSLSKKYIQDLSNEYQGLWHKRYIEGKWVLADGAVFDFFDEKIHIISMPTSPATYYIMGIDYGTTNPCVFVLIGYNPGAYPNMWLEKEYYYDSKETLRQKSDYEYVKDMEEFMDGYYVKQIYIDPSAASLKQEMVRNGIDRISDAKNDVLPGIRFMGQLLTNGTYKICAQCTHSIKEFSNYLWDSKASERGLDVPIKRFDHCFVAGTPVTTSKGDIDIDKLVEGDHVLTPIGYKKVLKTFIHQGVGYEFDLFGTKVKCTENHRFYTANRGWIQVKDMVSSDIILLNWSNEECTKRPSFLKGLNIIDIYAPQIPPLENIIEHINGMTVEDIRLCTEPCGTTTMGKFQKDCTYITSTAIPSTMILVTSSYSLPKSTLESMKSFFQKNKGRPENSTANNVHPPTPPPHAANHDFVAINVKVSGDETITLMMSREFVLSVIKDLQQIGSQKQHAALDPADASNIGKKILLKGKASSMCAVTVESRSKNTMQQNESSALHRAPLNHGKLQSVYSLHVEDFQGYYVHNTLTLNSLDAQRYALFSSFFSFQGKGMTENDAEELERMYIKR